MTIDTVFNSKKLYKEWAKQIAGPVQLALNEQVLKDSNVYVPFDVGTLESSGVLGADGKSVEWNMPYAKAQYYGLPNKSTDKHPEAQCRWFERAKAEHTKDWEELVNDRLNGKTG